MANACLRISIRSSNFFHPRWILLWAVSVSMWLGAIDMRAVEKPDKAKQVLTVSASIDHYPYSFRDKSGRLTGYAVDLLDAVAEVMKVRLQRMEVTPEQDIANLQQGKCDIGQFHVPLPGRKNPAEFSQPVLINYGDIFVRKGTKGFHTIDDLRLLRPKMAGPEQAYEYLIDNGIDRKLVRLGTSPDCLKWLSTGKVDVVVLSRLTGLAQAHYLGISNVEPVGAELRGLKISYCITTRLGDTELIGRINEALATLSVTGKTVEIYSKWFGRYEAKGLSRLQILSIVLGSLVLALAVALWALRRQRQLRNRIVSQASELRKNEEMLAEAQRFSHLGHWQHDLTGQGRLLWSAETFRIFERRSDLGTPSIEELVNCAVPADRERWRNGIQSAIQNLCSYELDLTIEPGPGIQKYIQERSRPVLDDAGNCIGRFGTVQDVTSTRTAEEALRRSEQLLSALYENLPLGLGAVENSSEGWVFMSINPAAVRQFALSFTPQSGCQFSKCGLSQELQQQWVDLFLRCIETREPLNIEITRKDIRQIDSVTVVPLSPADGHERCFFLIEDVTKKRRQDAEIAQGRRLRAIGELVGGIAHEFNNLLTPIAISSEALLAEWGTVPELGSSLKTIADAANRSAELTQRLLSFGRKSEKSRERIDLPAIVEANVQLARHTMDRRILIDSSMPQDLPPLYIQSSDLHQILLNLLLNARDALMEKLRLNSRDNWQPQIGIQAAFLLPEAITPFSPLELHDALSGWIRLTIRDNGCGLSPEALERLFEPFYTTKPTGMGTGLSLAAIWHLVAEFGGRIDVESTPDDGSAFHICIPVIPAPLESDPLPEQSHEKSKIRAKRFLVSEDEPAVSILLDKMLRRQNHKVTCARDGMEAWNLLSSNPEAYDAVIMDLNMPGINGMELAHRIRKAAFNHPLIVMSGRITEEERRTLAQLRIADVVYKPFTIKRLEEAIEKAFSSSVNPQ
jgi:two-component system, cell cycle sensor histidine kinase and response regulator CckA